MGDPKVADVTVLEGDIILINGVSAGYTTLLVWDDGGVSTYNLVVTAQPPMDLSSVERLLKPWNVQLSWWRQYLIVQGRLDSEQEKEAVESLLASLWEPVISLLSVKERPMDSEEEETFGKWDGSTDELRAQKIQQALGVPDVTVQVVKDLAILEGRVATEADSLRALEIARQFSPQVLNLMEVVEVDGEAAVTQGVVSVDALKDVLPSESTYENLGESSKTNRAAIIDDLRNLCAAWGYSLDSLGDVFILAGETQDRRRKDALLDLLTAHGLAFVDATSPKAQDATAEDLAELEDMLRELPGLWDVEVSKKGRRLLIAGWAEDPAVVHVAESLVRDYGASLGLEVSSLVKLRSSEKGKTAPSLIQKEIGIPGLVVRWVGDTLVLEGTLNSKEHQAAVALASQYSSSVVDLISDGSLSPLTIAQIKSLINSDDVLVKAVGNTVVLTGTVTSLEEKQAALALASAFGYPVVDALVIKDREIETPMLSESAIRRAIGIETVKVSLFNGTVLLEGTVEDRVDKIRAERIAETFGVPVVNLIEFRELPDEANRASELEDSLKWEQLVQEAAELGASLYIAASTPVLKGQVSPEAGAYLEALLDSELPHWINRLEILHPQEQLPSLDQIRSSLGNPAVECRYVGNTLILQGEVRSEEERQQIETIASKFGVPVESFITVAEDIQQIWVDVCMLELSYSDYRELGIDWKISLNNEEAVAGAKPPPGGFFQTEEGSKSAFSVVVGPLWLETHLHSLLRSGMARILASPSLLTENRQTAEFLAGGEIPVPGDVEGIGWKSYGVGLQVTPSILDNGTIHLQVEPEVSSLDWENAVQLDNALIPGVRTRRWRTQAAVEPGRTLIIGGLLSEEENIRERQVPILGELPILGTLFRNEVRTRVKTDLVVLVTPRIIDEKHLAGWEFKGDY
ncbi:MAG: BON domain-containing protein [Firmicutes bacterium]|nr:BON domain-containing protein [Bacillota bacterium]